MKVSIPSRIFVEALPGGSLQNQGAPFISTEAEAAEEIVVNRFGKYPVPVVYKE